MNNKKKKNDDLFDELFNEKASEVEETEEIKEELEQEKIIDLDKAPAKNLGVSDVLDKKKVSDDLFTKKKPNLNDDKFGGSFNKKRQKARQARIKMTPKEYNQELERLNEGAENKNYIFLLGMAGAGKSYIIASLLRYMTNYLKGQTRLNKEIATEKEALLYNQMIEMFDDRDKNIARTDVGNFYELNIIYKPEDKSISPLEITFIDVSGEHVERIYDGEGSEQVGELPDYLEVILESDVNCKFVFVHDQSLAISTENTIKAPQSMVLKSLYDKVCTVQERNNKIYPKVLLLSKADKIPDKVKQKYRDSATEYAKAAENGLSTFSNGFFSESNNRAIFYRMGTFTKYDTLDKFDANCPAKLFNWLYGTIHIGQSILKREGHFQQFKKWFLGH